MAQLGGTFDATQITPQEERSLLPAGEYPVIIVKSEMKPTKKGDGQYLALEMDIQDGPHKGRKVWDNLNLINPNKTAEEIAQRSLSAICHATGQMAVSDSEQLHGRLMLAVVGIQPAKGQYAESNTVKTYKAAAGGAQSPAALTQADTGGGASAAPWNR